MVERVPAVICDVKSLSSGTYVEQPGWDPNYVVVEAKLKVSRVNIIGVITSVEQSGESRQYMLDDSTGNIVMRSFDDNLPDVAIGDPVVVIGRPRRYQDQFYIVPEIMRKIDDRWIVYRKAELGRLAQDREKLPAVEVPEETSAPAPVAQPAPSQTSISQPAPSEPEEEIPEKSDAPEEKSDTEKIYDLIVTHDPGDGADITTILEEAQKAEIENAEKAIHLMLEMGDIFEIRAGKVKVL